MHVDPESCPSLEKHQSMKRTDGSNWGQVKLRTQSLQITNSIALKAMAPA